MVKPRQSSRGHTQVVDPQSVKTIHAWSAGLCHIVSTAASSQDCVLHLWVFEHMAYSSPSKIKSICNSERVTDVITQGNGSRTEQRI